MEEHTMKTDALRQVEVLDELRRDGRVEATDIGVKVDRALVTLTRTVDCASKRVAAVEAGHRVPGVLNMANDIAVPAPGTGMQTDTEIVQDIQCALTTRTHAPYRRIDTAVSAGRGAYGSGRARGALY
jgi:hypothetical protein